MVLGKLPMSGRPRILITVGQGPNALVTADGVIWIFYSHLSFFSSFSLSWETARYRPKTVSKGR